MTRWLSAQVALAFAAGTLACGGSDGGETPTNPNPSTGPFNPVAPATTPRGGTPTALSTMSQGAVLDRFTTELWTYGTTAYTTTSGYRTGGQPNPNVVYVWDIGGSTITKVDSVPVEGAGALGDIQTSDDGRILVVATEWVPGSIAIFDLADPKHPKPLSRFASEDTKPGVHTAEVARVNGKLYAFLSIDPSPSKLVIVDLSDLAKPVQIYAGALGNPFIHDVFVRDGFMFTALWNDGLGIWDIGGANRGGSPSNPVLISRIRTINDRVHNAWWYHDGVNGSKQYVFVGEESNPFTTGVTSHGDIHVVDVQDMSKPVEVARFTVTGAGAHNFSVDERGGVLYSAFYNGGVRALDVRGRLGECAASAKLPDGRCDLERANRLLGAGLDGGTPPVFVWGVRYDGTSLYASDMLNGLWKLKPLTPP
jgi:hypothetical protein